MDPSHLIQREGEARLRAGRASSHSIAFRRTLPTGARRPSLRPPRP